MQQENLVKFEVFCSKQMCPNKNIARNNYSCFHVLMQAFFAARELNFIGDFSEVLSGVSAKCDVVGQAAIGAGNHKDVLAA